MKSYMLSLKEKYFNRILDGSKPFEFRRAFAKSLDEPFIGVIYVSLPIQAVKGIVLFDKPIKKPIDELLGIASQAKYPFTKDIEEYFHGKEEGYMLKVKKSLEFENPIPLKTLQGIYPNFKPPQSFYGLDKDQFVKLRNYIHNHESRFKTTFRSI